MLNTSCYRLLVCAVLTLPMFAGCGANSGAAPANAEKSAEVQLHLLDLEGFHKLVAAHKGKVVVVDCWSTSCEPCKEEFPKLVALHKKFGVEKVACVSLSFDYEGLGKPEDAQPRVLEFLKKQGATFDNILSKTEADVLYKKLELNSVPTVLVYDREGKLSQKFEEEPVYKNVGPHVEKLLAAP